MNEHAAAIELESALGENATALAPAIAEPPRRPDLGGLKSFHFHQLVSLIEMQQKISVGRAGKPAEEFARFRATRSLSFGASDISHLSQGDERLEIRINFFGLYGPASPLPPSYTERIIEEDLTPSAVEDLFDLFNHRLISLLHVVWRKYRYYLRYESGGIDPLSKRFLALCGFPIEDRSRIGDISRSALLPHIGLMSLYSSSAEVVAATLSNFFRIPCRIEQFVPRRVAIGPEALFRWGVANNRMGEDIIMGTTLEDDLGKFRLRLGPAPFSELEPFLPGGERHRQLADLMAMINREPLEWDIACEFEPETVPTAKLGECRMGWSGWMYADDSARLQSTVHLAPVDTPSSEADGADRTNSRGAPTAGPVARAGKAAGAVDRLMR